MDFETTIVAVSSPHGNSPRALIRACGNNIFESSASTGVKVNYRKLTSCNIEIPEGTLPILCMAYPAQYSYVGQDTLEIMLPNNRFVIDSVVRKLIEVTDGRYAEAGEFTARAFFNGKMSLSEAEGVCATISANNDCELRGAALLREGVLNSLVIPISQTIAKTLALVEAGIDFTDALAEATEKARRLGHQQRRVHALSGYVAEVEANAAVLKFKKIKKVARHSARRQINTAGWKIGALRRWQQRALDFGR